MAPLKLKRDRLKNHRIDIMDEMNDLFDIIEKWPDTESIESATSHYNVLLEVYGRFTENRNEFAELAAGAVEEEDRTAMRAENKIANKRYLKCKTIMEEKIPFETRERSARLDSTRHSTNSHTDNLPPTPKHNVKLPTIQIKTFTGKYEDWEEFKDIFRSCYCSDNNKFDECQKLLYLKTHVQGEPLGLIKNLKSTNENFQAAWDLLEERYQHPGKTFKAHVDAFLDIEPFEMESAKSLKHLLDTTNASLAALNAMEVPLAPANPLLVHLLERKLDEDTLGKWAEDQKGSKSIPTYDKFEKFLIMRINILENVLKAKTLNESNCMAWNKEKSYSPVRNSLSSPAANTSSNSSNTPPAATSSPQNKQ